MEYPYIGVPLYVNTPREVYLYIGMSPYQLFVGSYIGVFSHVLLGGKARRALIHPPPHLRNNERAKGERARGEQASERATGRASE